MHTRLIFIVGAPRSGTTLLAEMLSSHPDICSSPETHYFSRYTKKYSRLTRRIESESVMNFKTIMQERLIPLAPALPTFGDERAIGARFQPAPDKMLIAPEATA